PGGPLHPQDEPGRAAPALERARRRDVPRRAPAAAAVRDGAVRALAYPPHPRGEARCHRPVAGHGAQPHDVRRDGPARPPLCAQALVVDRSQDPAENAGGSDRWKGRGLMAMREVAVEPTWAPGRLFLTTTRRHVAFAVI